MRHEINETFKILCSIITLFICFWYLNPKCVDYDS